MLVHYARHRLVGSLPHQLPWTLTFAMLIILWAFTVLTHMPHQQHAGKQKQTSEHFCRHLHTNLYLCVCVCLCSKTLRFVFRPCVKGDEPKALCSSLENKHHRRKVTAVIHCRQTNCRMNWHLSANSAMKISKICFC